LGASSASGGCFGCDGGTHRDSLVQDNRRQNAILRAGYDLLRYTAPDVLGRPEAVAAEVRARLKRRYAGAKPAA